MGPATLHPRVVRRLQALGVSLFRINLSHTRIEDVRPTIAFLQEHSNVPICLDSEGAQIRTGPHWSEPRHLEENCFIEVRSSSAPGNEAALTFTPANICDQLLPGDLLTIDFHGVVAQVAAIGEGRATLRILNGGEVGKNKAVTVHRELDLPRITSKDREAIRIGREMGVKNFALSFANRAEDVLEMRELIGEGATLISKIESLSGLANLEEITRNSAAILIDRGDLSRQVPLEKIPAHQKDIIRRVKAIGRPVYVATNLLESMVRLPAPTRAEINDIYNTLADGADGLVLAAETAIGHFPVRCATMVAKVISEFEKSTHEGTAAEESLLIEPHGGVLVEQIVPRKDHLQVESLPRITVTDTDLLDAEQIALGTYSPLRGFMDRANLTAVLEKNRLADDTVWTLPITLQVDAEQSRQLSPGDRVALCSRHGTVHAVMDVTERFEMDPNVVAQKWFGTSSTDHPGVARIVRRGPSFLAGNVSLVKTMRSSETEFMLTPSQTRFLFHQKGWQRIVAFHTRNVPHRAHEHIQIEALRRTDADGILISPVIGPRKHGDFESTAVLASYQACLANGVYPKNHAVLSGFASYPRYAGPREAVFTAICRKNMGCSHFIVGRDHTGITGYYKPNESQEIFETVGEIGIEPVFFSAIGYDAKNESYGENTGGDLTPISGTEVRNALQEGREIPEWLVRHCVQAAIRSERKSGRKVFVE
jgi:ATP sulfurylase